MDAFESWTVPLLIWTAPVWLIRPERVRVPVLPVLRTKPPVATAPEKVAVPRPSMVLFAVRVALFATLLPPSTFSVPPFSVTPPEPSAPLLPASSVPPLTLVVPE